MEKQEDGYKKSHTSNGITCKLVVSRPLLFSSQVFFNFVKLPHDLFIVLFDTLDLGFGCGDAFRMRDPSADSRDSESNYDTYSPS